MDYLTEDMAFSPENQKWIKDEIQNAIAHLSPPKGWKKALRVLRENAPLGGIFAVVLALIAIVITLAIATFSRRDVEAGFRGTTEEKLKGIDRQLVDLRALVAANHPDRLQNQQAAKQLLSEVKNKLSPPIPTSTAQQVGQSFVDAAPNDPGAWNVALQFVDYRSGLNELPPNQNSFNVSGKVETAYQLNMPIINGVAQPGPRVYYLGSAPNRPDVLPQAEAARVELLANPQKQSEAAGIGRFALRDGNLDIDGMFLRHVTVIGVNVYYSGQPARLEDVSFINCNFNIDNNPQGRSLALAILGATKVDFQPTQN